MLCFSGIWSSFKQFTSVVCCCANGCTDVFHALGMLKSLIHSWSSSYERVVYSCWHLFPSRLMWRNCLVEAINRWLMDSNQSLYLKTCVWFSVRHTKQQIAVCSAPDLLLLTSTLHLPDGAWNASGFNRVQAFVCVWWMWLNACKMLSAFHPVAPLSHSVLPCDAQC